MGILPPGRYAIAVSTTGQYLQMIGNEVSTGEGSGDKDEQWRVLEAKEGWFYVQNAATEYYLSVDGSKVIGTPKPVTEWFAAETSLNSALYYLVARPGAGVLTALESVEIVTSAANGLLNQVWAPIAIKGKPFGL